MQERMRVWARVLRALKLGVTLKVMHKQLTSLTPHLAPVFFWEASTCEGKQADPPHGSVGCSSDWPCGIQRRVWRCVKIVFKKKLVFFVLCLPLSLCVYVSLSVCVCVCNDGIYYWLIALECLCASCSRSKFPLREIRWGQTQLES